MYGLASQVRDPPVHVTVSSAGTLAPGWVTGGKPRIDADFTLVPVAGACNNFIVAWTPVPTVAPSHTRTHGLAHPRWTL